MRIFLLFALLTSASQSLSQSCPRLEAELALLNFGNAALPEDLGSSRTAVMVCHQQAPVGEQWKELAAEIHGTLVQMSIDPILYFNAFDFYANEMVNKKFDELLKQRRIKNLLILIVRDTYQLELVLVPFNKFLALNGTATAWRATGNGLGGVLYQLGTTVKEADLPISNFLIATKPEFLEDINLFQGDRLPTYAGAMRRQKVGLALLEEIQIPGNVNNNQRQTLESYNAQVQATNQRMQEAFEAFKYDWQPIVYTTDEAAMGDRIQYIVFLIHTSGEHIRKMLNYDIDKNETDYLSVTPGAGEQDMNLKRISSEELVFKVYVTQTRSSDVFVGREWDADDNAGDAVRNFVFTWTRQVGSGK